MADPCSIAGALSVVGDRWSLLVVREIVYGRRRFSAIAEHTGAPRDVLTARLRKLEEHGVIERVPYQDRPPRDEYHLTDSGRELGPLLVLLLQWGDAHAAPPGGAPVSFEHRGGRRTHRLHAALACTDCGHVLRGDDLHAVARDGAWRVDLATGELVDA